MESGISNDRLRESSSLKTKSVHPSSRAPISLPRLKKIKRDLLTDLQLDSHESQQDILAVMRKSFHWPISNNTHEFRHVQAVNNPELTAKYLEKRREWKSFGYSDSLLVDSHAFLPVENQSVVEKICRNGVRCGNQPFSGLGVSHMAVHLSKHGDILVPNKQSLGDKICILVKLLKGKVKTVACKNVGIQLEPTPNYDCHIAKPGFEKSSTLPYHLLFYSLQLYVYEYGDLGVEDYPKQVLPCAVIYYKLKEPSSSVPKHIPSVSRGPYKADQQVSSPLSSVSSSMAPGIQGPKNEVWRGKLHISLIDGGNLNIEVSLFAKFVPLTVNILSPLKIYKLCPESSAQITYFAGLTDIADKAEVPWREHFFRSFVLRPRSNNEEHFKALMKHVSEKREMPCIRLAGDVYFFMMSRCLLSSQLGLVHRDDHSPVLYCVLMSKFSTVKAEKKKMKHRLGNGRLFHYGKAKSWLELFDDSDDESEDNSAPRDCRIDRQLVGSLFHQQRALQNKLACMSLADTAVNISPCDCALSGKAAYNQRVRRFQDTQHLFSNIEASLQNQRSNPKESISHFPSGSRTKLKRNKISRRSRAMPSFSPHGSSSSDSDSDFEQKENGRKKGKMSYSVLMSSHKTVEEELSEEELTAEQMDDIIFMRKPVGATKSGSILPSQATAKKSKLLASGKLDSRSKPSPCLEPKIIPTEPLRENIVEDIASPPRDSNNSPQSGTLSITKIIPTDPVNSSPSIPVSLSQSYSTQSRPSQSSPASQTKPLSTHSQIVPKSILKNKRSAESSLLSQPLSSSSSSMPSSLLTLSPSALPSSSNTTISSSIPGILKKSKPAPTSVSPSSSSPLAPGAQSPRKINGFEVAKTNTKFSTTAVSSSSPWATTSATSPMLNWASSTTSVSSTATSTFYSNVVTSVSSNKTFPVHHHPTPQVIPMLIEEDMGDVDMRLELPYNMRPNVLIPSIPGVESKPPSAPSLSPNLATGSWLAPGDLPPSKAFPVKQDSSSSTLTPALSSSSSSLHSAFKPSAPIQDQLGLDDTNLGSPPSMSPPSPSPLDSPMSPPKSPDRNNQLESPASPPTTAYDEGLRSSPIAIPTVRVKRSIFNMSPPSNVRPGSPSPRKMDVENNLPKQVNNADDMKDFLNLATGFDSEGESPFEDEREETNMPKEMENADDMKDFLNATGGFDSESPNEDESDNDLFHQEEAGNKNENAFPPDQVQLLPEGFPGVETASLFTLKQCSVKEKAEAMGGVGSSSNSSSVTSLKLSLIHRKWENKYNQDLRETVLMNEKCPVTRHCLCTKYLFNPLKSLAKKSVGYDDETCLSLSDKDYCLSTSGGNGWLHSYQYMKPASPSCIFAFPFTVDLFPPSSSSSSSSSSTLPGRSDSTPVACFMTSSSSESGMLRKDQLVRNDNRYGPSPLIVPPGKILPKDEKKRSLLPEGRKRAGFSEEGVQENKKFKAIPSLFTKRRFRIMDSSVPYSYASTFTKPSLFLLPTSRTVIDLTPPKPVPPALENQQRKATSPLCSNTGIAARPKITQTKSLPSLIQSNTSGNKSFSRSLSETSSTPVSHLNASHNNNALGKAACSKGNKSNISPVNSKLKFPVKAKLKESSVAIQRSSSPAVTKMFFSDAKDSDLVKAVQNSPSVKLKCPKASEVLQSINADNKGKGATPKAAANKPAALKAVDIKPATPKDSDKKPAASKVGDIKPAASKAGDTKPAIHKDSDIKPATNKAGDIKPAIHKDSDIKPATNKAGDTKPAIHKDSDKKPAASKVGDIKPAASKVGDIKPAASKAGDTKPAIHKDSDIKPAASKVGDIKPAASKAGDTKPAIHKDSDKKPAASKVGDTKPATNKAGDIKPAIHKDSDIKPATNKAGDIKPVQSSVKRLPPQKGSTGETAQSSCLKSRVVKTVSRLVGSVKSIASKITSQSQPKSSKESQTGSGKNLPQGGKSTSHKDTVDLVKGKITNPCSGQSSSLKQFGIGSSRTVSLTLPPSTSKASSQSGASKLASKSQVGPTRQGKDTSQALSNRRNHRAHPYSRPQSEPEKPKFASFDLAYQDLQDLLECMTRSTFCAAATTTGSSGSRRRRTPHHPRHGQGRFANYHFVRSKVLKREKEANLTEYEESDVMEEFEERARLADQVEELMESSILEEINNNDICLLPASVYSNDEDTRIVSTTSDSDRLLGRSAAQAADALCVPLSEMQEDQRIVQISEEETEHTEDPTAVISESKSEKGSPVIADDQERQAAQECTQRGEEDEINTESRKDSIANFIVLSSTGFESVIVIEDESVVEDKSVVEDESVIVIEDESVLEEKEEKVLKEKVKVLEVTEKISIVSSSRQTDYVKEGKIDGLENGEDLEAVLAKCFSTVGEQNEGSRNVSLEGNGQVVNETDCKEDAGKGESESQGGGILSCGWTSFHLDRDEAVLAQTLSGPSTIGQRQESKKNDVEIEATSSGQTDSDRDKESKIDDLENVEDLEVVLAKRFSTVEKQREGSRNVCLEGNEQVYNEADFRQNEVRGQCQNEGWNERGVTHGLTDSKCKTGNELLGEAVAEERMVEGNYPGGIVEGEVDLLVEAKGEGNDTQMICVNGDKQDNTLVEEVSVLVNAHTDRVNKTKQADYSCGIVNDHHQIEGQSPSMPLYVTDICRSPDETLPSFDWSIKAIDKKSICKQNELQQSKCLEDIEIINQEMMQVAELDNESKFDAVNVVSQIDSCLKSFCNFDFSLKCNVNSCVTGRGCRGNTEEIDGMKNNLGDSGNTIGELIDNTNGNNSTGLLGEKEPCSSLASSHVHVFENIDNTSYHLPSISEAQHKILDSVKYKKEIKKSNGPKVNEVVLEGEGTVSLYQHRADRTLKMMDLEKAEEYRNDSSILTVSEKVFLNREESNDTLNDPKQTIGCVESPERKECGAFSESVVCQESLTSQLHGKNREDVFVEMDVDNFTEDSHHIVVDSEASIKDGACSHTADSLWNCSLNVTKSEEDLLMAADEKLEFDTRSENRNKDNIDDNLPLGFGQEGSVGSDKPRDEGTGEPRENCSRENTADDNDGKCYHVVNEYFTKDYQDGGGRGNKNIILSGILDANALEKSKRFPVEFEGENNIFTDTSFDDVHPCNNKICSSTVTGKSEMRKIGKGDDGFLEDTEEGGKNGRKLSPAVLNCMNNEHSLCGARVVQTDHISEKLEEEKESMNFSEKQIDLGGNLRKISAEASFNLNMNEFQLSKEYVCSEENVSKKPEKEKIEDREGLWMTQNRCASATSDRTNGSVLLDPETRGRDMVEMLDDQGKFRITGRNANCDEPMNVVESSVDSTDLGGTTMVKISNFFDQSQTFFKFDCNDDDSSRQQASIAGEHEMENDKLLLNEGAADENNDNIGKFDNDKDATSTNKSLFDIDRFDQTILLDEDSQEMAFADWHLQEDQAGVFEISDSDDGAVADSDNDKRCKGN